METNTHFSWGLTKLVRNLEKRLNFQNELKWKAVLLIGFFHIFGLYWGYCYVFSAKWQTIAFAACVIFANGIGITCGVHRLWTHKSYKAKVPLRIMLMLCFSSTGQNSIFEWVRDHRLHHKYSDTPADPHNVNRGFWFAHIGWLMMKKNKLVIEKGRKIDMSDIENDPVAMFERRYSTQLSLIFCYFLPTITGILLWDENWKCSVAWQCLFRVLVVLHAEMTVNSLAHIIGYKPYNKDIKPVENCFVTLVTFGEGWHNYHHTFPNDYKAAETFDFMNWSTKLIRLWAKMGLAYDLKEASPELVKAVVKKLG